MLVCLSHWDIFWNNNVAIELRNCQPGAADRARFRHIAISLS